MAYPRSSSLLTSRCMLAALTFALGCTDDAPSDGTEDGSGTGATGATSATTAGTADSGDTGEVMTSGATGNTTPGVDTTAGQEESSGDTGEPGVACIDDQFVNGPSPGPNYAKFDVPLGSHCQGTNQQDIADIERVVFIGDSVTVGTRPTGAGSFYRTLVADQLAAMYGLTPPEGLWEQANPITGQSVLQESGDFASCAEWGARNDDLEAQLTQCFSAEDFDLRTLVISTMGGNDVANIAQDAIAGAEVAELFAQLEEMVAHHETAVRWLTEPGRFTNGIFVVNANVYEFTDYTLDLLSCPAASTAGFSSNPDNPDLLLGSLNLINEEYMRIAQENGTDVVFMFEGFCGHGFHADDPTSPCYRGPGAENWFDFTCIHPTPPGHQALAEMFVNVIAE